MKIIMIEAAESTASINKNVSKHVIRIEAAESSASEHVSEHEGEKLLLRHAPAAPAP